MCKLRQSQYDYFLYIKETNDGVLITLVYVDDILVTKNRLDQIIETKASLHKAFKMKDLGELKYFIGIEFARSKQEILMHQKKYAPELISEIGFTAAKPTLAPLDIIKNLTQLSMINMVQRVQELVMTT